MDTPPVRPEAALPEAAPPVPARGRSLRWLVPLGALGALLVLALLLAGGAVRWMLETEAGARWLLARAPGIEVTGLGGTLLGPHWQAERLRVAWDGGRQSVLIEGLQAEGVVWAWRPDEHTWLGVQAQRLTARKVTVLTGPSSGKPVTPPASLVMPLHVAVADLAVQELRVDSLDPIRSVLAQGVRLDASPGGEHRVASAAAEWQGVHVEAAAQLGTAAPLQLQGQATLRPALGGDAPAWAAALRASGPLTQLQTTGTLRGRALGKQAAPEVDASAQLHPFERWPLGGLELRVAALDLAALWAKAPQTSLTGRATLSGGGAAAPLTAQVTLDNAQPGRWNEGRLPLRRLSADLEGRLQQRDRLELRHFEAEFADAMRDAGRVSGTALWQGHELSLDATLQGVTPQRLDGRAAAMQLGGPVTATLRGLPSPDPADKSERPGPAISWKLDLEGRLEAAPQAVRLAMEGSADDDRLELKNVHARSGSASAGMSLLLQRARRGEWQLGTRGNLAEFDPVPWWPGDAGSPWRQGPHRLSADWDATLRLPPEADRLPALAMAQRVVGNGTLRLHDSLVAGVPLSGTLTLGYTQAAAPSSGSLIGELQIGGNRVRIDGRGNPLGDGATDRLRAELSADDLAALAPLVRLVPSLAPWVPRRGSAQATVAVDGRWPTLHTEGQARVQQLQAGTLELASATATWSMGTEEEQALSLQAELAGLRQGAQQIDHLRANLRGTLADHRIDLTLAAPVAPAQPLTRLLGVPAHPGTLAALQARGAWAAAAGGGGRWSAAVDRLVVAAWDGKAAPVAPATGWASAQGLKAEIEFGPDRQLSTLHAAAGRLQLADAVSLRWQDVRVDLRPAQPLIELRAEIDPFALAPLLARMQPDLGWEGDLRLAARLEIRAAEHMDADVVFERRDGDLNVAGPEGLQLLGLTEIRLALSVHDGLWLFNPVLKGRSIGEINGSARVQTTPERRWPHAEATVDGTLQAEVADIGIWGAWVPPGWRMTGEVRTTVTLGGRFGQPRYVGRLAGTGLGVRNLLQGVNVSDGEVALRLDGDTATVERFVLRGGEGRFTVTGGATLGNAPTAQLKYKAERFRLLGRVDRLLIASGDGDLTLGGDQTRVNGRFEVDEGVFDMTRGDAPTLDDDVTVHSEAVVAERAADPAAARTRRNVALNLDIDMGQNLRVRGRGLDTGLRGKVHLSSPGGQLAVNGTITTEEGTYKAYAQKLSIERGIVAFSGAADNPRLDVLALRPNIDQRVGVLITGPLQGVRVRLYSEPELTDSEKLSWLVLGRAPDGLGRSDTALLQRAAVALLAGEGEAPTDALMKNLGIDELSLRQSDGEVRETVISLGKQLSRRWYVGYERGVNSTTGTWQLVYRIAQRFTLRLQSGLENSADVIWVWRAQETPEGAGMRKSSVVPP